MPGIASAGEPAGDDIVQPFQIERSGLRGRMVRLGAAVDAIVTRHPYPEPVATLLGESVVLAAMLASGLKYDGVFTLQAKGDGPVSLMAVDVTADGNMRGYARYDAASLPCDGRRDVVALVGAGHLAFTVDQGEFTDRYQGIVALTGATMADCLLHYFRQSEQIDAGLTLAAARAGPAWRAGGLMVQRLPEPARAMPASDREDDWRRAMILMGSATERELVDPALPPNDLLFRLFHEDGVRVFAPKALRARCRCSRARVAGMLGALPRDEIEALKEDGRVNVQCEFCNGSYSFDDRQLERVYAI